jgi:hypothetical protein
VGSHTGTGPKTVTVSTGTTFGNTGYIPVGNTRTTASNGNVYTVSFKSLGTTSFDITVTRIDSLFSGWTDPGLYVSWIVYYT